MKEIFLNNKWLGPNIPELIGRDITNISDDPANKSLLRGKIVRCSLGYIGPELDLYLGLELSTYAYSPKGDHWMLLRDTGNPPIDTLNIVKDADRWKHAGFEVIPLIYSVLRVFEDGKLEIVRPDKKVTHIIHSMGDHLDYPSLERYAPYFS